MQVFRAAALVVPSQHLTKAPAFASIRPLFQPPLNPRLHQGAFTCPQPVTCSFIFRAAAALAVPDLRLTKEPAFASNLTCCARPSKCPYLQ